MAPSQFQASYSGGCTRSSRPLAQWRTAVGGGVTNRTEHRYNTSAHPQLNIHLVQQVNATPKKKPTSSARLSTFDTPSLPFLLASNSFQNPVTGPRGQFKELSNSALRLLVSRRARLGHRQAMPSPTDEDTPFPSLSTGLNAFGRSHLSPDDAFVSPPRRAYNGASSGELGRGRRRKRAWKKLMWVKQSCTWPQALPPPSPQRCVAKRQPLWAVCSVRDAWAVRYS